MNKVYKDELVKAIFFENWLRFYFLLEQANGKAIIFIPEANLKTIEQEFSEYLTLVNCVNKNIINLDTSREAIINLFDKSRLPELFEIINSSEFISDLDKIQNFVQLNADYFDTIKPNFNVWCEKFYNK